MVGQDGRLPKQYFELKCECVDVDLDSRDGATWKI